MPVVCGATHGEHCIPAHSSIHVTALFLSGADLKSRIWAPVTGLRSDFGKYQERKKRVGRIESRYPKEYI